MRNSPAFASRARLRAALGAAVLTASALFGGTAYGATGAVNTAGHSAAAEDAVHGGMIVRDDLQALFRQAGVRGTFALFDVRQGRTTVVDAARAQKRLIPASTFKIAHSLIALETKAVKDENEVIPYGGQPQQFPEWEHDMNLRDAIRVSNVPVFQTLARRIGLKRENQWVNRLNYGNGRIGPVVDRFWLDGPLEISAVEQTRFLSRLARQQLPASKRNQLTVRELLKIEEKDGYALFAKTGWGMSTTPNIGWWVGWVERGDRLYTFALNIDVNIDKDTEKRIPLTRDLLTALGVLPKA
ncbi:class D beta-lactamase [Microtetraspora malaysiensis]|uniref:class D beta-lactamase n=1 Tax=Microtetraspora malaysiensis TaxID=161358 RepID=UPI00082E9498|nr:class D beta-lactamase [Microtetraspora malaysiensis]